MGPFMPVRSHTRIPADDDPSILPEPLRAGTLFLASLRHIGLLNLLPDWMPLARRGGHGTRSLFAVAVLFLMAGPVYGIRPFLKRFQVVIRRCVAPVAGLRGLPSSAALSRALSKMEHAQVRPFLDRLLCSDAGVSSLLRSPHVQHRDAHGQGWHVLDLDPTVTAFRQRTLPEGEDLPPPQRRAVGKAGYTGHKRGEIRLRHIPVVHGGAGLWLSYRLSAESSSATPLVGTLVSGARKVVLEADPLAQVLCRCDGEFGSVGAMRACIDAGVPVLTRLSRYNLLDEDEARVALQKARWRVVSNEAGRQREAAELGNFTLLPSDGAAGSREPVTVRVIVTRLARKEGEQLTHGVLREGYQLELFATTLEPTAWPAQDVVELYFGRAIIENCFAQEDREFGLERTFSFQPAGQEWMVGVGLYLWNVLVCRGLALAEPLPPTPTDQLPRPAEAVAPESVAEDQPMATEDPPFPTVEEGVSAPPELEVPPDERAARDEAIALELWAITSEAYQFLEATEGGWKLDHQARVIRCSRRKPLSLVHVEVQTLLTPKASNRLLLRAELADCRICPLRATCIPGKKDGPKRSTGKQFGRAVSAAKAERASDLLRQLRHEEPQPRALKARFAASVLTAPGPWLPATPAFQAATSRRRLRAAVAAVAVDVSVRPPATSPSVLHPCLAMDRRTAQHRRKSWVQRDRRQRLRTDTTLRFTGKEAAALLASLFPETALERAP